ncbi:hypothetical protein ZWY2020_049114 [Hordeum vulgare]|nr:hypothetical protein ZWY2020_049114 [Hordeum vulgare]
MRLPDLAFHDYTELPPHITQSSSQDKALIGHVLDDLKEVASIVREATAQQFDRMCTLKKMDECLRRTLANGRRTDDLITKCNDEEDRVVTAASKESLKNVSHLYKEGPLNLRHNKNVRNSKERRIKMTKISVLRWGKRQVVDVVIEIMCHHHPKNTRDGHVVYIERVAGVAMLERDGKTWYYEKWRVHQLDSTISYASRLGPLIQNWSEEKAKKVDNIIQNNYLGVGEYVEDLMRPSIPTQDGTLAKPKTDAQVVDAAIELIRHDEPTDTRDDQLVYIERVADVVKLKRDGRIEK